MRVSCCVVSIIAMAACGGSHSNQPVDGSVDAPPGTPSDAPPDAAPDAPPDGSVHPLVCAPFTTPRPALHGFADDVLLVDVNGDGKLDALAIDGGLDVLLGNGDGTFQPAQQTAVPAGRPLAFAIADIDGDGDLDAVAALSTATAGAPSIQLLLGDGHGHFALGAVLPGTSPTSVSLGDLDGNGSLDIVTVTSGDTGGVAILFGTGGGNFAAPIAIGAGTAYDTVALGDVDGDHHLDVIATGGQLGVFRGHGDRTFEAPFTADLQVTHSHQVGVGDLDGDGKLDIVAAGELISDRTTVYAVEIWLGSGTGSFTARGTLDLGLDFNSELRPPTFLGPPFAPQFTLADYDGDGVLDLAVAVQQRDVIEVIKGAGTGDFVQVDEYATGGNSFDLASGDLNGDGRPDLVVVASPLVAVPQLSLEVMLALPAGRFQAARVLPYHIFFEGRRIIDFAVGDLDGDGKLDLAQGSTSIDGFPNISSILVTTSIPANGGGFALGPPFEGNPGGDSIRFVDVDGDGDLDMIVAYNRFDQNHLAVSFNAGGKLGPPIDNIVGGLNVAVGDLDGDHRAEILINATDGNTATLTLNASGTYTQRPSFTSQGRFVLEDFNGDHKLDLASYGVELYVSVALGNGDGTFQPATRAPVGAVLSKLVVADLNGDGIPDLAGNAETQTVTLIGHGDGTFSPGDPLPLAPGGLLGLADLDNVPPLDIVGRDAVIYRAGDTSRTEIWSITAADFRDVTGDGRPDLIGLSPFRTAAYVLASQCR
jgi:hypothetical protein